MHVLVAMGGIIIGALIIAAAIFTSYHVLWLVGTVVVSAAFIQGLKSPVPH